MSQQNKITFEDFDKLNLKEFAERLFQIMEKGLDSSIHDMGQKGSYTISLNAQFGNGKTTFLKMFEHFIKEKKSNREKSDTEAGKEKSDTETENEEASYDVLFINAWESDFYKEPVIAILSEFVNWVTQKMKDKNIENKQEEIINTLKGIIGVLGSITNQALQSKTGIDPKKVLESYKSGKNLFKEEEIISKGDDILNHFKIRIDSINEIKIILSKYLKSNNKKLLIIVDELDRARPDYAVHFLEDMKHFFDIENVVFLVAVNRKQMEATVKCLYGQEFDFEGYYRKFFKQEIDLPDPYKEAQIFVDELIQKTKVKYNPQTNDRGFRVESSFLSCKMFNLTLREIEIFIRIFEQILSSDTEVEKWGSMDCYSFFICMFLKDKEIFHQMLNGDFTVRKFISFVKDKNIRFEFSDSGTIRYEDTQKIPYKYDHALSVVACSFMRNKDSEEDISLITSTFQSLHKDNIRQLFSTFEGGFDRRYCYDGIQPAVKICEHIHQCKSVFNN